MVSPIPSSSSQDNASIGMSDRFKNIFTPKRVRILKKMGAGAVVSSIPVFIWWKWATIDRQKKYDDVRTRVRIPSVQTIDDLMIERCRPGDILLFDRRWEHCATGPLAALVCLLGRTLLCTNDPNRSMTEGKFDHCGIIVPGYVKNKGDRYDKYDPSNLLLMEATAGEGITARPLLTRLEMSESRSVVLLPLAIPGERRNDQFYEPTSSVIATEQIVNKKLEEFRDSWIDLSKRMCYDKAHSTLGFVGSLAYALGLHNKNPGPISPSAWLVTKALADAKIAQNVSERNIKESKVEDYLRDCRFQDQNVIQLRPGWRLLAPVSFREK
mmetsp:Transcript_25933/g.29128  ORF Transcript_25933/g.29128 Transcript_25933/m.29128 type:complete len:326 (+) Transcript_25933:67-1044(+)